MLARVAEEVAIRPMTEADAALVVEWRTRDDVHRWLFAEKPPTIEDHLAWFRRVQGREEYVILYRGRPVGTCGLADVDRADGGASYGVALGDPAVRGLGIARRAGKGLLARAFGPLGRTVVWAERFADNYPSARHLAGLGFVDILPPPPPRAKEGVIRRTVRACVWPGLLAGRLSAPPSWWKE